MTVDPHLLALSGLDDLGPFRLRSLLEHYGDAELAWHAVRAGDVDDAVPLRSIARRTDLLSGWRTAAAGVDVGEVAARHDAAGIEVLGPLDPRWPAALADDPEPPSLLFVRGDAELLGRPSVAVIGTRRCTAAGIATARDLGHDLAAAGVGVVSGLAMGIDGAAHRGSLRAAHPVEVSVGGPPDHRAPAVGPAIGVVATGLDVVYPRRHHELWDEVASRGVLVSEYPLGTRVERWRFPARNRLIAALALAVVVVESPARGGSMVTVDEAIVRDTEVLAVPGPVRAPTSDGPNRLLVDGCAPVRDATDVLVALGTAAGPPRAATAAASSEPGSRADDPVAAAVSWPPASLDELVSATGLGFDEVASRLTMLELDGVVERTSDGYQRVVR